MASVTKYAGTVTQTTGGHYVSFDYLGNIRNAAENSHAVSSVLIQGKSETKNRPSTISCTGFNFNLPLGAEPTKIVVEYRHRKNTGSDYSSKYPKRVVNIPAPTISLLGVSGFSGKGVAPTTSMKTSTKTFNVKGKITRAQLNSGNFGCRINYPTNTNKWNGYLRISYVRVRVEYVLSDYTVKVDAIDGFNNEAFDVTLRVSNKNLTRYNPTLTLTTPVGFSYESYEGTGRITKVNNTTYRWEPMVGGSGTSNVTLRFLPGVTYPSGSDVFTGTFTLSESLNGANATKTISIRERPVTSEETAPDSAPVITGDDNVPVPIKWVKTLVNEEITNSLENVLTTQYCGVFGFPCNDSGEPLFLEQDTKMEWKNPRYINPWEVITFYSQGQYLGGINYSEGFNEVVFRGTDVGKYVFYCFGLDEWPPDNDWEDFKDLTPDISYFFEVVPEEEDLTIPNFTVLEPTEEEFDRLGDGYPYVLQSDLKHTTSDTYERDWYKNNRLGVFNNEISIFFDEGVTGSKNSNWYIRSTDASSLTVTVDDEGTTLSSNDTSTSRFYFANPENSTSTYPPITLSDFVIECDVISTNFGSGSQIAFLLQGLGNAFNLSSYTAPYHLKMVKEGTTVKQYINDTEIRTTTISDRTNYYAGFQLYKTGDIKFKNYKIYAINPTKEDLFTNAEYWSNAPTIVNEYNNLECEFTYNENYPLYLIFTGDYPETTTYGYDMGTITHNNPAIIEKQVYKGREQTGNYPEPITNLLDENIAETSIPNLDTTETIVLYDFPLEEEYGTDETHSIRGIEVTGTIEQADEMVLSAKLVSPSGETGERTIIINNQDTIDSQTEFKFGGLGDLWGFQTTDLTHLNDWEVQIFANNILLEEEANLNFGDIRIGFYIKQLEEQLINVKVNGEDLSYYGAFIEDAKIPEGLDTDTSFLSIDGTDTNDAYRQNIREKTIELEMSIGECDLQTSTDMLRQLTKLLVNEKDEYNRPIPNTIEFSHYPDVYFEYIMTDTMDITTSAGAYTIKAKLTIPAGTAYSKQNTSTNITGFVQGIASVNPVISLKAQDNVITLQETVTGQKFTIGYDGDWQTGIVEIDCEERRVYHRTNEDDTEPTDLSKYVDFNSDWFNLHGEYNFNASGCTVRKVEFTERW